MIDAFFRLEHQSQVHPESGDQSNSPRASNLSAEELIDFADHADSPNRKALTLRVKQAANDTLPLRTAGDFEVYGLVE